MLSPNDSIPTLSIVTPSYNQGNFIEDALDSVICQSFDDIEHLVIDGGSSDNTIDILEDYESKYDLRWISEPDGGQSEAINKGIEMAKGEFIGWLNADDYYLPNAFETFNKCLNRQPNSDIIYGDLIIVDTDRNIINKKYHGPPSKFVQKYWRNYTANHCTFIRQSVFNRIGGVREDLDYVMDAELFWRMLNSELTQTHQPEFIAAHRIHPDAKTGAETAEQHKFEREYLNEIYSSSWIDEILPQSALKSFTVGLQIAYYIRERRWNILREKTSVMSKLIP